MPKITGRVVRFKADIVNYTKGVLGGDVDMLKVGRGKKSFVNTWLIWFMAKKSLYEAKAAIRKTDYGKLKTLTTRNRQDATEDNEESEKSKSGVVEESEQVVKSCNGSHRAEDDGLHQSALYIVFLPSLKGDFREGDFSRTKISIE
ncbi:hypothetical protein Tco_0205406, partial [Tanacetum coccineum]